MQILTLCQHDEEPKQYTVEPCCRSRSIECATDPMDAIEINEWTISFLALVFCEAEDMSIVGFLAGGAS